MLDAVVGVVVGDKAVVVVVVDGVERAWNASGLALLWRGTWFCRSLNYYYVNPRPFSSYLQNSERNKSGSDSFRGFHFYVTTASASLGTIAAQRRIK